MSEEKDRFGKKLRDKERGEESRYFAEQDKRKLEALKAKKSGEEEAAADARCPRCATALIEKGYSGVYVDECPHCGGVWLDRGELEAISARAGEGWMSTWIRSLLEGKS